MSPQTQMLLEFALAAPAAAMLVPAAFLAIEVLLAKPRREAATPEAGDRPPCAVLIPAHDEQASIGATLVRLRPRLGPRDRVLVVADNCSDATAIVARNHGALVLERSDAERRGKGYALAAGLAEIERWQRPPAAVVVLDADCRFDASQPDGLAALVRQAVESGRPAQAVNLVEAAADAGPRSRIAVFAFRVKNLVRPLGLARLGGGCLLTGTGMAFPLGLVRPEDLASSDIVEDMRLGVNLAIAGRSAQLCTRAQVRSPLAPSDAGWRSQRTRWEQGHLRSIAAHAPRLVRAGLRRPRLLLLALELAVPPLSLLALAVCSGWALAAAVVLATAMIGAMVGGTALGLLSAALLLLFAAVWGAWRRFGQNVLRASDLARAAAYAAGKLGIYAGLLRGGERRWVRTERV